MDEEIDLAGMKVRPRFTPGAYLEQTMQQKYRLVIPSGPAGSYRLSQLDNYAGLDRREFPHHTPFHLGFCLRASESSLSGTWGVGLWNDPFGFGLPGKGGGMRLPTLPQAAWFFFASPENHLALREDLPGHGWLAMAFRSRQVPAWQFGLAAPTFPLLAYRSAARLLRRLAGRFIRSDSVELALDPTDWHHYSLDWMEDRVRYWVDHKLVLESSTTPAGCLGLVIWIDNQKMSFPPDGRLRYGTLATPQPAWIEIGSVEGHSDKGHSAT